MCAVGPIQINLTYFVLIITSSNVGFSFAEFDKILVNGIYKEWFFQNIEGNIQTGTTVLLAVSFFNL